MPLALGIGSQWAHPSENTNVRGSEGAVHPELQERWSGPNSFSIFLISGFISGWILHQVSAQVPNILWNTSSWRFFGARMCYLTFLWCANDLLTSLSYFSLLNRLTKYTFFIFEMHLTFEVEKVSFYIKSFSNTCWLDVLQEAPLGSCPCQTHVKVEPEALGLCTETQFLCLFTPSSVPPIPPAWSAFLSSTLLHCAPSPQDGVAELQQSPADQPERW